MNPYVKSVKPHANYHLELVFENGERRVFDLKSYLGRGVFERLQNLAVFQAARVVAGSVEWPGGVDLSYDTLYLKSQPLENYSAVSPTTQANSFATPHP
jgi:hypothetical protein